MKNIIGTIALLFALITAYGQSTQSVPFTLQDRDRIIRTEQRVESLRKEMNTRFEAMDTRFKALETKMDTRFEAMDTRFEALETKMDTRFNSQQQQIDDLKTMFFWGFGIMITLMIFMMGYMIWDRRTAMNPVREKVTDMEAKQNNLIRALKEHSKEDPKLADILRSFGLF